MKPLHKQRNWKAESIGWLFMGQHGGPCDKSCIFCYYAFQKDLVFYDLPTMIGLANLFRHYYGLDGADITGGEPTIYKGIVELVRHCRNIGLSPRIITHGQNNHDAWTLGGKQPLYQAIEEAGLELWRVSLHGGSEPTHDHLLGSEQSFKKLVRNLDNVTRPVQFNTTLTNTNFKDLPLAILHDRPPTVYNMIYFLPYFYWSSQTKLTEAAFQVQYREAAPYVARAIEDLESRGWEVNLRYWPLCIAEEFGFAENVCNYHQVPFDPWEWRLNVTGRTDMGKVESEGGWEASEVIRAREWMAPRMNPVCQTCRYKGICGQPPEQYQTKYGLDELRPVEGEPISDPLYFQKRRGAPIPAAAAAVGS